MAHTEAAGASRGIALCIDVGSSSTRVSAFAHTARNRGDHAQDLEHHDKHGHRQFEDGLLLQAGNQEPLCIGRCACDFNGEGNIDAGHLLKVLESALDQVFEELRGGRGGAFHITHVAFATFTMSCLGVAEEDGAPCTPVYTYANRSRDVLDTAAALRRKISPERRRQLHNETGAPLHAAYASVLLAWWHRREASGNALPYGTSTLRAVGKWQTFASHVIARWCGLKWAPISLSEASTMGLLNAHTCEWHPGLLTEVGADPALLPELADVHEFLHTVEAGAVPRWPEMAGARVSLPIGDGAASTIGSKCVESSRMALTIGTSAAMRVVLPTAPRSIPPELWCYRIDRQRVLLGGALTDGGSVMAWVREMLLGSDDMKGGANAAFEALVQQAGRDDASDHGLTVLPFLGPERSTGWHEHAQFVLVGATRKTQRCHFVRAAMEAVALRLKAIFCAFQGTLECPPTEILASGTALEVNGVWRQLIADALGEKVVLDSIKAATTRGALLMIADADVLAKADGGTYDGTGIGDATPPLPSCRLDTLADDPILSHPRRESQDDLERKYSSHCELYTRVVGTGAAQE